MVNEEERRGAAKSRRVSGDRKGKRTGQSGRKTKSRSEREDGARGVEERRENRSGKRYKNREK